MDQTRDGKYVLLSFGTSPLYYTPVFRPSKGFSPIETWPKTGLGLTRVPVVPDAVKVDVRPPGGGSKDSGHLW